MSHRMIFPCRLCWKLSPSLSIKISEGAPLCNKLCLLREEPIHLHYWACTVHQAWCVCRDVVLNEVGIQDAQDSREPTYLKDQQVCI